MINMRMLIRILFVIFIAKGIDCLGKVCDNCCDCFKEEKNEEKKNENNKKNNEDKKNKKKDEEIKEYEEIEEDEKITAKSLVNDTWYNAKENKPILKIFKKEGNNDFQSKDNGDKISINLDKDNNPKIEYINGTENKTKFEGEKYALFEIKTQKEKTVYLYCSDVESCEVIDITKNKVIKGIFNYMPHESISVIACDTKKVTNMNSMFYSCTNLKEIVFGKNFNTENVINMGFMFSKCSNLTKLDLKIFNTTKVTNMNGMFSVCSNLKNLNLNNFNTTNVTNMEWMFLGCSSLKNLKFGQNFNTEKVKDMSDMFSGCNSFPEDIRDKLDNVEEIIKFFKEKNN